MKNRIVLVLLILVIQACKHQKQEPIIVGGVQEEASVVKVKRDSLYAAQFLSFRDSLKVANQILILISNKKYSLKDTLVIHQDDGSTERIIMEDPDPDNPKKFTAHIVNSFESCHLSFDERIYCYSVEAGSRFHAHMDIDEFANCFFNLFTSFCKEHHYKLPAGYMD
jgi:hypothetical protein